MIRNPFGSISAAITICKDGKKTSHAKTGPGETAIFAYLVSDLRATACQEMVFNWHGGRGCHCILSVEMAERSEMPVYFNLEELKYASIVES